MKNRTYQDFVREAEQHLDYWIHGSVLDFTEEVVRLMNARGVSRAELARRLGTSQAYITKLLGGEANFTLATMVKVARALESDLRIHLAPSGAATHWFDDLRSEAKKSPSDAVSTLPSVLREPAPKYKVGTRRRKASAAPAKPSSRAGKAKPKSSGS